MYGSLLLFFWAFFFNYDSLSFFGIRQIMNFLKPAEGEEAVELKKSGLLGLTRHPMYLALIIFLWCQVFTLMDFIINIILTVYVFAGTLLEERKLVMEFGQAYRQYQMEVPMLIPSKRKMTARRI
jgi:protein-S-isoprenylcysteine O-methyltransferase Ste14